MAAKAPKKAKATPQKQPVDAGDSVASSEQSTLVDGLVSCVLLTSLSSVNQSWHCGDVYQDTAENVERLISLGMASPQKGE